jgi:signal transduction histidine kinase
VSFVDVSGEKRRRALERIFFHDVINTAGGIQGALELLRIEDDPEQFADLLALADKSAHRLVEEIQNQRTLTLAENNDLSLDMHDTSSYELLESVAHLYEMHPVAAKRSIWIEPESEDVPMRTDVVLMQRVLGNLVKNALEACQPGEQVRMGCRSEAIKVEFWVQNPGVMSRDVQLQIFQRSFSTKGMGRGLGTYSIKLLSERYLQGNVSFSSREGEGTVFTARYPFDLEKA